MGRIVSLLCLRCTGQGQAMRRPFPANFLHWYASLQVPAEESSLVTGSHRLSLKAHSPPQRSSSIS